MSNGAQEFYFYLSTERVSKQAWFVLKRGARRLAQAQFPTVGPLSATLKRNS
jgi:hypothetical protein